MYRTRSRARFVRLPLAAALLAVVLVGSLAGTAAADIIQSTQTLQTPSIPPAGQTRGRVTRDQATIWRPGFASAAVVVKAGAILIVTARAGDWYEVLLPPGTPTGGGSTGYILASQVEIVPGSSPPPRRGSPTGSGPAVVGRSSRGAAPPVAVRGFGQFGYQAFDARQSFKAVLGQPGGVLYGGGGEVRFQDRWFVDVSIERFSKTGERVFVSNGSVFKLGISDKVTMTPLLVSGGYRFVPRRASPYLGYLGAGVGRYSLSETSDFANPSENVSQSFTSYSVLGGIEFRTRQWVAPVFEVQYTHVPNALGLSGASAAYNEHNLGGFTARVKVLVGR
ncbi:MAG TPA: hypothetical protein VNZ26_25300 [Vicinamibacterales bacterium]|nr:hypothetical protein [Vicinamibacterales bacterium]